MKALTVKQPWAWAIINGGKNVENRSKPTKYRGNLYIHGGLGYAKEAEESQAMQEAWINAAQALPRERGYMGPLRQKSLFLDYGFVIGTVDVIDCHADSECLGWAEDGSMCSGWAMEGYYHWVLASPRPLACPFPETGKLGIWNMADLP